MCLYLVCSPCRCTYSTLQALWVSLNPFWGMSEMPVLLEIARIAYTLKHVYPISHHPEVFKSANIWHLHMWLSVILWVKQMLFVFPGTVCSQRPFSFSRFQSTGFCFCPQILLFLIFEIYLLLFIGVWLVYNVLLLLCSKVNQLYIYISTLFQSLSPYRSLHSVEQSSPC